MLQELYEYADPYSAFSMSFSLNLSHLKIYNDLQVKLPFTFLKIEMIFTIVATVLYIVAFIVLLSGFGWCTTSYPKGTHFCDARVTGGVIISLYSTDTLYTFSGVWNF